MKRNIFYRVIASVIIFTILFTNLQVFATPETDLQDETTIETEFLPESESERETETDLPFKETETSETEELVDADMAVMAAAGSASIERVGYVNYGTSTVGEFKVNGTAAFCWEHSLESPYTNMPNAGLTPYNNADIAKTLYYGWGGTENIFSNKNEGWVGTSLLLSHYYSGTTSWNAAYIKLKEKVESSSNVPDPTASFSRTTATSSVSSGVQKSQTIKLNGNSNNKFTLSLPANVTIYNTTTNTNKTGGSATIKGGDSFYFTAPLSHNSNYNSGNLKGSMKKFQPYIVKSNSSYYQDIGYAVFEDYDKTISFTVQFQARTGDLTITKKSSDGTLLSGATFEVKDSSGKKVATVTTGSAGTAKASGLYIGQNYTVTETKAPAGFKIDTASKNVTMASSSSVEFSNTPFSGTIELEKKDAGSGDYMDGAEFTIQEYNGSSYVNSSYKFTYNTSKKKYISGKLVATPKNQGKFRIVETKVPAGFTGSFSQNITLSEVNQTLQVTANNTPFKGKIELSKKDSKSNEVLERTSFSIHEWDKYAGGFTSSDYKISYDATAKKYISGTLTATNANEGKFKIIETKPSGGYYDDLWESEIIQLTSNNQTLLIDADNDYVPGRITLVKKDAKTDEILTRTEFKIKEYSYAADEYLDNNRFKFTFNAQANHYESDMLIPTNDNDGRFLIIEDSIQPGYTGSYEKYIQIPSDITEYEYNDTVLNTPASGIVKIKKKDSRSNEILERIIFQVYEYSYEKKDYVESSYKVQYDPKTKQYISDTLYATNDNEGRFKLVETGMQNGYFGNWGKEIALATPDQAFEYEVENYPYYGKIEIEKTDKRSKEVLERASFILYEWSYAKNSFLESDYKITFNADTEKYESPLLYATNDNEGKFYVEESESPAGYTGTWKTDTISLTQENQLFAYNVTNDPYYGHIKIKKQDSLTAEILERAEFTIYEWSYAKNDFYESDHKVTFNPATQQYEAGPLYSTNDNGGRFKIAETVVPDGYSGKWDSGIFHLSEMDKTFEYTVKNQPLTAKIEIQKKDSKTGALLSGAKFLIQEWSYQKGSYINTSYTFTFDTASKKYVSELLTSHNDNGGRYQVVEVEPPYGYAGQWTSQVLPVTKDGQLFELTVMNDPIYVKIDAAKNDKLAPKNQARGGASLEGAQYGLYTDEAFVHPDGRKFAKDQLIATTYTDAKGQFSFDTLYPALYYIQEISPSEGYLLDDTKYPIDGHEEGNKALEINRKVDVYEEIKSQAFQLIKIHSDGSSSQTEFMQVTFKIYPIETLSEVVSGKIVADKYGKYNASDFINYEFTGENSAYDVNGNAVPDLVTDKKGYAVSPRLVYGQYIVVEQPVEGYLPIKPFIVDICEDSDQPQEWRIFNNEKFKVHIKIIKKDSDTNNTVLKAGAKYRIFDMDNKKYVEQWATFPESILYGTEENPYTTTTNGVITLPQTLDSGTYRLEEVAAPAGYVLQGWEGYAKDIYEGMDQVTPALIPTPSEEIIFRIEPDVPIQVEPGSEIYIMQVIQENKPVYGKLNLYKYGEYANSFASYGVFAYKDAGIPNAKFAVYSAEDIYSQDNQKTLLYGKNKKIETLTTDEHGQAWTTIPLPIGNYYVVEEMAGTGFLLDDTPQYFSITYDQQESAIVYKDVVFENSRQKIEIEAIKKDLETEALLEGATIGLYSAENIYGLNGKILAKPDTLLAKATTNSNGMAIFDVDLPHGRYYSVELEAPKGYLLSDQKFFFDCSYTTQSLEKIIHTATFTNKITELQVIKKDKNTNKTIYDAEFALYATDKSGKPTGDPIDEWTITADKPYIIKGLEIGQTYVIREIKAPTGYILQEDTYYTIEDTSELQIVTIFDDMAKGTFAVTKEGEFLSSVTKPNIGQNVLSAFKYFFKYLSGNLENVEFAIYAADDIVHPDKNSADFFSKGDYIATIKTDVNGIARFTEKIDTLPDYFAVGELPLGCYMVEEISAGENHLISSYVDTVFLNYESDKVPLVIGQSHYINDRQKISITLEKLDSETNKPIPEALFALVSETDIYAGISDPDANTTKGDLLVPAGTTIAQSYSNNNGQVLFDLDVPHGEFTVREVLQPDGYTLSAEKINIDAKFNPDNQVPVLHYQYQYKNTPTELTIRKETIDGSPLKGAMLAILDAETEEEIHSWKTDQSGEYYYQYLHADHLYVLKEILPAPGYVTADPIYFMIESDGTLIIWDENQFVVKDILVMQDKETEIEVGKIDSVTGAYLTGATLQIIDTQNAVVKEFLSKTKPELITGLPIGEYILRESGVPSGYLRADDTPFTINDTQERQSIVMDNTPIKGKIAVTKEGAFLDAATQEKKDSVKDLLTHIFHYINGRASGVKFAVYAAENIIIPGSDQEYYYTENEHIADIVTDKSGIATINEKLDRLPDYYQEGELPLGRYYVVEIHPGSNGHTLSSYTGSLLLQAEDDHTPIVYASTLFLNDRQKIEITGKKIDAQTLEPLEDAVFSLVTAEDIYAGTEKSRLILPSGSTVEQSISNADGQIVFSADIPHGKYFVQESEQPDGYVLSDEQYIIHAVYDSDRLDDTLIFQFENQNSPTEVTFEKRDEKGDYLPDAVLAIVDENGALIHEWTSGTKEKMIDYLVCEQTYYFTEIQPAPGYVTADAIPFKLNNSGEVFISIDNAWIKTDRVSMTDTLTQLQIQKKDILSGRNLPGARLQIWDSNDNIVHDFITTEEPEIITGLPIGSYTLHEIDAPEGFFLAQYISFEIVDTPDLQTVELIDEAVKGKLLVTKEGEFLTSVERDDSIINKIKSFFHYTVGRAEGVRFAIHAGDTITHPVFTDIIYFEKGEFVAEIVTDTSGIAEIRDTFDALPEWFEEGELPLGTYTVTELTANNGHVLNTYLDTVILSSADTETPIVYGESSYRNERQKISIQMLKYDHDTNRPIEGTIFALYNKEDIYSESSLEAAQLLLPAGTLIEHFTTDNEGLARIQANLPGGVYEIIEYQPSAGYAIIQEPIIFDASYDPDRQEEDLLEFSFEMENMRTEVNVLKLGADSLLPLPGAELAIYEEEELIYQWKSSKEAEPIYYLKTDVEYRLSEIQAPKGYATAEDIYFKLSEEGNLSILIEGEWVLQEDPLIQMIDEAMGHLSITKLAHGSDQPLSGAVFSITSKDTAFSTELTTDENGFTATSLLAGDYLVKEIKAPDGYLLAENTISCAITVAEEEVQITVYNQAVQNNGDKPPISILKTDDFLQPALFIALMISSLSLYLYLKKKRYVK